MKYPAVYSYKKSRTRELELSIESLRNIAEWDGRVFIIGDKPDFEGDYTHLQITYTWGKKSQIKSNDEICAYLTAADFLKEFIIMADDIYILKPWSLRYHHRESLEDHADSRTRISFYGKQLRKTRDFLISHGESTKSFELHIPFRVRSNQLKEAADMIRRGDPMLIRSVMGNWYSVPSKLAEDPKNKTITDETVLYSSSDSTFDYEKVKRYLT
jgi:hypothetical protein